MSNYKISDARMNGIADGINEITGERAGLSPALMRNKIGAIADEVDDQTELIERIKTALVRKSAVGGGGVSSWNDLEDKPFESLGANLKVVNGALTVDTAQNVQQDNTKPITSAAVYTEVGNINALLATI